MNHTDNVKDFPCSTKATISASPEQSTTARRAHRFIPLGVLLVMFVFVASVLSVPLLPKFLQARMGSAVAANQPATIVDNRIPGAEIPLSSAPREIELLNAFLPSVFPFPPPPTEPTITFYDGTCSTLKTIFNPGDAVCAKVEGINPGLYTVHLDWDNARGEVLAKSTNITASGQTRTFTLSANASIGGWHAVLVDQSALALATGDFAVSDPDNHQVDLSVNNRAQEKVTAGNDITYRIVIFNRGPDAAESVVLTEPIPDNTTLVGISQLAGPVFSCTSDASTTTCTISSMPANTYAILSTTYNVVGTTPNGTTITSSVSVTNNVTEQNADDNSASVDTVTAASPCVVTCGTNVTVPVDSGQPGAVVNYPAPSSTGACGAPISCSQASGSFFPIGTTPVTCVADTGDACSFTVTVENPGGLSILLNGDNPITAECGSGSNGGGGFDDPGASAVNGTGGSVPVTISGSVNLTTPGTYTLTYTATEGTNSVSTTRSVNVVDTTAPSIQIQGANPYKIQQGSCSAFSDPGASANDGCAGPVAVTISISGPGGLTYVDNNTPGTYTVTYSATDGSHPATAARMVLVGNFPDDELDQPPSVGPPTIQLNGMDQIVLECGTTFTDPGATATACGAPVAVTVTGSVDTQTPGVYTLTYTATNSGGTGEAVRTITVVDTTPAVLTLSGANPYPVECGSGFTDPGATANDACAGSLPVTASGAVDPNTPGTYVITYSAPSDPSGNPTQSVTRTVVVADTLAPVITVTGDNPATVECHTSYTDAGATANDACTGPVSVSSSGSVDVNTPGTYTITYSATDGSHPATATRTVTVFDTTPPVITLNNYAPSMWPPNHRFTTFQLTQFVTGASDSCDTTVNLSSVVIEKVTSDELENSSGDGNTLNDIVIGSDCKSVQLRSERNGGGDGRVYTITFRVRDAAGNTTRATATVVVPHNPGETVVNSGVQYTVNSSCP